MQSSVKSATSIRLKQLEKEFLAMMVEDVGQGVFKDCEKEEFQEVEEKGGEEFYLEEGEQEPAQTIKTAPFNKFLNLGVQKVEEQPQVDLDELAIDSYNFVFGCNEGKTVEMVEGKVCRAIGVNIFLDGFIYPSQADRNDFNAHSYQICYLSYDSNSQLLYSGSNGRSSEIIEWHYRPKEKTALIFKRKVTLPSSSLGVGFTFKLSGQLFCISKWSLHKQAQLFGFDLQSTKRTRLQLQLGKVVGLCEALDVYLINQRGLHMLAEAENGFELVKITQSQQFATSLDKVGSEYLLVGLIDGSVEIVNPRTRTLVNKLLIGSSPILAVKMISKHIFIASTSEKSISSFQLDSKMKHAKNIDKFEMKQVSRNILVGHNGFICCLKGGKMQSFDLNNQGKLSKTTNKIEETMHFPKEGIIDQRICYSKQADKYFYFTKGNDSITIFQLDSKSSISKTSIANLTHPVHLLDSQGTILAAISCPRPKHSSDPVQQVLQFYDFIELKSISILQELPIKQCTCIKYNPDGDKLALGFADGQIIILNTNLCKDAIQITRTQSFTPANFSHQTPIQTIIWSHDGKYLKTISKNHLLFYGLSKNNDESYSLTVYDGKKGTETMKSSLLKSDWSQMGRFNWRTAKVWSRASSVDQYVDIVETGSYLFASLDSGDMEVFTNPAGEDYHALFRWFKGPYKMQPVEKAQGMVMMVAGKGALICVNIS